MRWYYLDTGWACGAVVADAAGVIREAAPIFRRLLGARLASLPRRYRLTALAARDEEPARASSI